jgi:hypothetical protein
MARRVRKRKRTEPKLPEVKLPGVVTDPAKLAQNLDIAAVFTLAENSGTHIVEPSKKIQIDNLPTYK